MICGGNQAALEFFKKNGMNHETAQGEAKYTSRAGKLYRDKLDKDALAVVLEGSPAPSPALGPVSDGLDELESQLMALALPAKPTTASASSPSVPAAAAAPTARSQTAAARPTTGASRIPY
jgi:hypothetical protein